MLDTGRGNDQRDVRCANTSGMSISSSTLNRHVSTIHNEIIGSPEGLKWGAGLNPGQIAIEVRPSDSALRLSRSPSISAALMSDTDPQLSSLVLKTRTT